MNFKNKNVNLIRTENGNLHITFHKLFLFIMRPFQQVENELKLCVIQFYSVISLRIYINKWAIRKCADIYVCLIENKCLSNSCKINYKSVHIQLIIDCSVLLIK